MQPHATSTLIIMRRRGGKRIESNTVSNEKIFDTVPRFGGYTDSLAEIENSDLLWLHETKGSWERAWENVNFTFGYRETNYYKTPRLAKIFLISLGFHEKKSNLNLRVPFLILIAVLNFHEEVAGLDTPISSENSFARVPSKLSDMATHEIKISNIFSVSSTFAPNQKKQRWTNATMPSVFLTRPRSVAVWSAQPLNRANDKLSGREIEIDSGMLYIRLSNARLLQCKNFLRDGQSSFQLYYYCSQVYWKWNTSKFFITLMKLW